MEGPAASGASGPEEVLHLLVVLVDISDAFQQSSRLEEPSQRVRYTADPFDSVVCFFEINDACLDFDVPTAVCPSVPQLSRYILQFLPLGQS